MNNRLSREMIASPLMLLPPPIRWRILLSSVLVMTAFVLILTVGKIAALLLPPQADILAPYQTLLPGKAEAEIGRYPCALYQATYDVRKVTCVLTPETGMFRRVSVFTSDGKITGINFHMRRLRLLDLLWQWGQPDRFYQVSGKYEVEWKRQFTITAEIGRLYSAHSPVRLIVITEPVGHLYSSGESYLCGGKVKNPITKWACDFPSTLNQ